MYRITQHPILDIPVTKEVDFFFNGQKLKARDGEVISSALFANGIKIFGSHHKNNSAQGIFCANGQCAQCTVIADSFPVKACITPVKENMNVQSCEGLPSLLLPNPLNPPLQKGEIERGIQKEEVVTSSPLMEDTIAVSSPLIDDSLPFPSQSPSPARGVSLSCQRGGEGEQSIQKPDVLIIGAGPAGLSAAIELGKLNVKVLLIDDKHKPGGKLVLQTHNFFGSVHDCYAGTRGIDIANILADQVSLLPSVKVWLNAVAIGVFSDKKIGVVKNNKYFLIEPEKLLVSTGAREKALPFNGWEKPGVYGAGAFQTLVNRDLIKPANRIFVIGGGNVGLIAAYHALQANMTVTGIVEILPKIGGYKVHADKIKRLGVPVYSSHKVLEVFGDKHVQAVTIAQVNDKFEAIKGTEKTFNVDTVLIAVCLNPIDEFFKDAQKFGFDVFAAGDAKEIAEASAATFSGKIAGREIARSLGIEIDLPAEWYEKQDILKSKPKLVNSEQKIVNRKNNELIFPVIRCFEEIPCNPCMEVCKKKAIDIPSKKITDLPGYFGGCTGCLKCVATCPGLAITLVDFRKNQDMPFVTLPLEIITSFKEGDFVPAVNTDGEKIGEFEIVKIKKQKDKRLLVTLKVPEKHALKVAGIRLLSEKDIKPCKTILPEKENPVLCRCEQVNAQEIENHLKDDNIDLNRLKALTRAGMGSCGGKTCSNLIKQKTKGKKQIVDFTQRPLFCETNLETFLKD